MNKAQDSDGRGGRDTVESAVEASMETGEQGLVRQQLEDRRQQLAKTLSASPQDDVEQGLQAVAGLLLEVDLAIGRIDKGTYGICEECHESIEKETLKIDPLARVCLDHLTGDQKRVLEDDLEMASRIQRKLLPEPSVRKSGWEIHYHFQPVGPVSGDYCDLILPEDGRGDLWFLVGDASGKGVAASMLMTHLHGIFRTLTSVGLPLEQLLDAANRIFCQSMISGQYATLICGRLRGEGEVEVAGAGHVPALLVRSQELVPIPASGLPLGLFRNSRYNSRKFQLRKHDSLVLYTDGLSETRGSTGNEYGEKRLQEYFRTRHQAPAHDLIHGCLRDLVDFSQGATPQDDLTLMVIQRAE